MKFILSFVACFLFFALDAQIKEGTYDLSLGEQYGFMTDYPKAEKKMVEKAMEEVFEDYGKIKRNRKANEWYCTQCEISLISSSPLDMYYRIEEGRDLVTSYVYFDTGQNFISSANDGVAADRIRNMLMDVYYEVQRMMIRKEIEEMEKTLGDYEKDLSKLVKKNEDLHNDIEDYKERIRKAEKDIEENLNDQQDKNMEIEQQRKLIQKVIEKLNQVGRDS